MKGFSAVEIRKALQVVEEYKKARTPFVVMPCADMDDVIKTQAEANIKLENIIKIVEEEEKNGK